MQYLELLFDPDFDGSQGIRQFLRLRAARRKERRVARDANGQASSPGGYEALPGDEHGPTHLGRTSGALQA